MPLQSTLMYETSACLWFHCLQWFFSSVGLIFLYNSSCFIVVQRKPQLWMGSWNSSVFQKTIAKVSFYLLLVSWIQLMSCSGVKIKSWEGWDGGKVPSLLRRLLWWVPSWCSIVSKLVSVQCLKWQLLKPAQRQSVAAGHCRQGCGHAEGELEERSSSAVVSSIEQGPAVNTFLWTSSFWEARVKAFGFVGGRSSTSPLPAHAPAELFHTFITLPLL